MRLIAAFMLAAAAPVQAAGDSVSPDSCTPSTPAAVAPEATPPAAAATAGQAGDAESIDPVAFLRALVARYRAIHHYVDRTRVVQVTQREGEAPHRVETRIGCEIDEDTLRVQTGWPALWRGTGLAAAPPSNVLQRSDAMRSTQLEYQLWLAPHLSLRYSKTTSNALPRTGVPEGLTAVEAERVTIDERPLVHLELSSDANDDGSRDVTLDLYVDPESMLVERIEGQQRLPDGGSYETTMDITPITVVGASAPGEASSGEEEGVGSPEDDVIGAGPEDGLETVDRDAVEADDAPPPGVRPPLSRPRR